MTTVEKNAVKNDNNIVSLKDAYANWDKEYQIEVDGKTYAIADKPKLCKNKLGELVYKVDIGTNEVQFKIVKPEHKVFYTVKNDVTETPKKQQLIVDENNISVALLESLATHLSAYEILELGQKLLAIAMDRMQNPAKDALPENSVNTEKLRETNASSNGNGKKSEVLSNNGNGKKSEMPSSSTPKATTTTDNKETRGRKSTKTYALYWEQFKGYGAAKKQGLTDQQIADKYGIGKATVTEELRAYSWLQSLAKNEKTKPQYQRIIQNWKADKTTFSLINGAVKSGLNKSKPQDAIAMALGEKKLSYEDAVNLAKS